MPPSSLHNRGRKCAQRTRKWNSPAHHRGVGWCGCDWLCKRIGHSWNEPDGMMAVILETTALLVCVWKFRFCMTLWTLLPRDLEHSFLRLPWTPLHILVLICADYYPSRKWHQRVQTKNMSQDGLSRMSRTGVCKGGWLAPAPQSDAHWRMQQSATQARQTDALEAEWVACWLSALIPSLSFMQVQIWCHTLPSLKPVTQFIAEAIRLVVRLNELCQRRSYETGVRCMVRWNRKHYCFHLNGKCRREEWSGGAGLCAFTHCYTINRHTV